MPEWLSAGMWGLIAGSALLIGSAGFLGGGAVSMVAVIAIFVSNVPEGLSSSAGMKKDGRSRAYISASGPASR